MGTVFSFIPYDILHFMTREGVKTKQSRAKGNHTHSLFLFFLIKVLVRIVDSFINSLACQDEDRKISSSNTSILDECG